MRRSGTGSVPGSRHWPRAKQSLPPKSQTFMTTLDDGSLVLGGVELTEKALVLSVNSRARSDRGRTLLSETLGGLVGQPLVEMQSVEQLMESGGSPPSAKLYLSEDQRRAII